VDDGDEGEDQDDELRDPVLWNSEKSSQIDVRKGERGRRRGKTNESEPSLGTLGSTAVNAIIVMVSTRSSSWWHWGSCGERKRRIHEKGKDVLNTGEEDEKVKTTSDPVNGVHGRSKEHSNGVNELHGANARGDSSATEGGLEAHGKNGDVSELA
jgi:hypothetical protein